MKVHPVALARHLNDLIREDSRPVEMCNAFSRRTGVKRTQLVGVKALPVAEAMAAVVNERNGETAKRRNGEGGSDLGASALNAGLPVKQEVQADPVLNRGNVAWGSWGGGSVGPLTAEAINQGQLSDCYLLIAMYLIARLRPNFFDDIFVRVDAQTAVVQWYYAGYILQIRTSLLISTDYDDPANGDVRPELAEKTWGLVRSGISDYAQDNMGLTESAFTAFGLDGSLGTRSTPAIIAAMNAGMCVGLQTTPTATGSNSLETWKQSHEYGVVDFDASGNLTLVQPWYATKQITGVTPATVSGTAVFNLMHQGKFPSSPRILASMVDVPRPQVVQAPDPPVIAVPASAAPVLTVSCDHAGAHAWDMVKVTWASVGASMVTMNGAMVALSGNENISMPAADQTFAFVASGADGQTVMKSVSVKLLADVSPAAPTVPTPALPVADLIVRVDVVRASGKITSTAA